MANKTVEDRQVEARVRAHVREWMADNEVKNLQDVSEKIDYDNGNFSRIMGGPKAERGGSFGWSFVRKVRRGLGISWKRLLDKNPDEKFWDIPADEIPKED